MLKECGEASALRDWWVLEGGKRVRSFGRQGDGRACGVFWRRGCAAKPRSICWRFLDLLLRSMQSSRTVSMAVVVATSIFAQGEWIFSWPYNADGSCACTESAIGSYQNFTSQAECLEAFAASDLEYCVHDNQGITEDQCSNAVSIAEGQMNGECASLCTAVVARVVPISTFLERCKFEFVIPFDDSVTVLPDSCFGNYVYGYSDYDITNLMQAQPHRIFPDVPSPARCQDLCQRTPDCVYFSWRAIPDSVSDAASFQNFPETCILYDSTYMHQVFSAQVDGGLLAKSAYCNTDMLSNCHVKPWEQTDHFPLFSDYDCLACKCETKCAWLSGSHITGPAFCTTPTGRDECSYARPTWTSTLPPCEDITTTEDVTEAGTAETDTALETTASECICDTTTQPDCICPPEETTTECICETTTQPECICPPEETTTECICETTTQTECICPPEHEKALLSATQPALVGTMMMHREAKVATLAEMSTTVELETTPSESSETTIALSTTEESSSSEIVLSGSTVESSSSEFAVSGGSEDTSSSEIVLSSTEGSSSTEIELVSIEEFGTTEFTLAGTTTEASSSTEILLSGGTVESSSSGIALEESTMSEIALSSTV